ncbi:MAG: hypothetical protein KatS3mg027_0002 [Bacteroidia bacterium]|nr:MAG: hypothetical protein KatS3mg027_0002 [Bacteroidia bacterium]
MILTDPILGLVFLVSAAWLAWQLARQKGTAAAISIVSLGILSAAGIVAPWIVRNYAVHGELVPVKSTFGYAFWQGNHPRSYGTDKVPRAYAEGLVATHTGGLTELVERTWQARHETQYIDDLVLSPRDKAELGRLPEPERCKLLLKKAIGYIRDDPARYARLCLRRLRYFLVFDDTNPRTHVLAYRVFHIAFIGLTLWGLWAGRDLLPRLTPALASYAAICLFHTFTIASIRFRIPVEPFQVLVVATGLEVVLNRLTRLSTLRPPTGCAAPNSSLHDENLDRGHKSGPERRAA